MTGSGSSSGSGSDAGSGGNSGSGSGSSGSGGGSGSGSDAGSGGGSGSASGSGSDGSGSLQEINYFLMDHLGSVRVIVDAAGDVKERNDYYAFGAKHIRPDYPQSDNRYDYNGKEDQTTGDLKFLDYGFRMYDARLGRWFCVDALAEYSADQSPYKFCSNNPILMVDPDGRYEWLFDMITGQITRRYSDDEDMYGPDSHVVNFGCWTKEGSFVGMKGGSWLLSGSMDGYYFGPVGDDGWGVSDVNLWEDLPDNLRGYEGYKYDIDDLKMRYRILNSPAMYHGFQSTILNFERAGWAEPLTSDNYWMTYGHTLGTLKLAGEYFEMMNNVSNFIGGSMPNGRRFNMKANGSKTSTNSTEGPSWQEFNRFRAENKGKFSGYAGRGTNTKAAWNAYLKAYGYR